MGGDLEETGPPSLRWGTTHGHVPPIFGKECIYTQMARLSDAQSSESTVETVK